MKKYSEVTLSGGGNGPTQVISRRTVCMMGVAVGLYGPFATIAQPAERKRPQVGDQLIFDAGPDFGKLIKVEDLVINGPPVAAFARDREEQIVRDGSRLNRVMVVRLDPASIDAKTIKHAAQGVMAYSAVCTHTGCDVFDWNKDELRMVCPCHGSEFDVHDGARVATGPAPRPLAILPLSVEAGELRVAGAFTRRVGFQQQF